MDQERVETAAAEPLPEAASDGAPAPALAGAPAAAPESPRQEPATRPDKGGEQRRNERPPREPRAGEPRAERREGRNDRPERTGRPAERGKEAGRPGGARPFEGSPEIDLDKLISDSLYLDNAAHAVVARMRDMDSATKSQLRRLFNAVRRAVRAPENERQHQFVMLRARLAYTIARHSLRSLDGLERLLLQVTRKNDPRGYERFKDLFEAIVAYNE